MTMSGKEEEGAGVDIVEKVKAYLFEEDDFETTFMEWGQAHCDPIDTESEEMKLECVPC